MKLKRGDKAPEFYLMDDAGRSVGLRDFKGREILLYFYPKNFTSGCTKQACLLRDNFDKIAEKVVILGISMDNIKLHKEFKKTYDIPFILLSDEGGTVSKLYGVLNDDKIRRTTFFIDMEGKIKHVYQNDEADNHINEILERLK